MRKCWIGLAALLLGTTAVSAEMTASERESFRAEVRAYLIENPEVLIEAMEVLQQRQDQAQAVNEQAFLQDNAALIYEDKNSWVGGNPEGDVTLVEFIDYRCGYCRKAYDEVEELLKSDSNIRFIVKEYPILGPGSEASSQFAIAVRQLYGDDAYKAAHDALIALRGEPNEQVLARLASDLGHNAAEVSAKMQSDEVKSVIAANRALGSALEINGTPTFIVNQQMVRGYVPLDGMREIVKTEREG